VSDEKEYLSQPLFGKDVVAPPPPTLRLTPMLPAHVREAAEQSALRLESQIAHAMRACRLEERKVVREYWDDPLRRPKEIGEAIGLSASKVAMILRRPRVSNVVQLIDREIGAQLGVTAHRLIGHLAAVAFSDIRDLFGPDGEMKKPSDWSDEVAAAIESIETDELYAGIGKDRVQIGHTRKVKRAPKLKAIELLMQIKKLGQKETGNNVTVNIDASEKKVELINSILRSMPAREPQTLDVVPVETK